MGMMRLIKITGVTLASETRIGDAADFGKDEERLKQIKRREDSYQ